MHGRRHTGCRCTQGAAIAKIMSPHVLEVGPRLWPGVARVKGVARGSLFHKHHSTALIRSLQHQFLSSHSCSRTLSSLFLPSCLDSWSRSSPPLHYPQIFSFRFHSHLTPQILFPSLLPNHRQTCQPLFRTGHLSNHFQISPDHSTAKKTHPRPSTTFQLSANLKP